MSENRTVAVDCGTAFFQTAEMDKDKKVNVKTIRNAFVELEKTDEIEDILKQNQWQYVKDKDRYYVIGEDSLRVAKMFPGKVELRRPLQTGVFNKGEDQKVLIVSELINSTIGKAPTNKSVVCTCISSPSVDGSPDSTFHKARLSGILSNFGWNVKVIEEGMAVILSERPTVIDNEGKEIPYSGLGISLGAGRTNCVLAYKGLQILGMSVGRGGDFIDQKVAEQTDTPISQVMSKKEKELDFSNINFDDDVIFALNAYYESLIEYIFNHFSKKFMEVKSELDSPLDVIVAGGNSMPKGFCLKIEEVIRKLKLPFRIKEIKAAKSQRNAVVLGCLAMAKITQSKLDKESTDDLDKILGEK
jgi:hypothetical protein